MKIIDIENILLNENAYFYKKHRRITIKDINTLFRQSLDDKDASRTYRPIIRESLFDGSTEVGKISLEIFEYSQKPSFLKNPANLWENKTGLFLILEYQDYLAIIRKNVSGIRHLNQIATEIDYTILANFLVNDSSRFEKIVSNNLNTAENAIQTKTTEAVDLKGVMSRFGISKQVISALRLDNTGEKASISLNTSRVNSLNIRGEFNPVLFWAIKIIRLIDGAYQSPRISTFISGFAEPVIFGDEMKTLTPQFLFLRFHALKEALEVNLINECFKIDEDGNKETVDLLHLIMDNETLFKLDRHDAKTYRCGDTSIKINETTITIRNKNFEETKMIFDGGDPVSLQQYLNFQSHFIVTFDKPEYAYTHRKMFKDHRLLNDLDIFMNTFIDDPSLQLTESEKGEGYTLASTQFSTNSIFGFLETTIFKNLDCVICDDMGVEWGDYITIHQEEIAFFHCKHGSDSFSASNLEVVFGQAQKNLGFLELTDEMVEKRSARWASNYASTGIARIRRHPNQSSTPIEDIKMSISNASLSGNIKRSVYVVIDFLSKSELRKALDSVKAGNTFNRKGVTLQILWFVNSLMASANEINVQFKVICKP